MQYPKFINNNSTIGVPSPSSGAATHEKANKFKNAIKTLKKEGFNLVISKNIYNNYRGRSADKLQRAKEFNDMIDNNNIDMIITSNGGDFCLEILPYLDFSNMKKQNKFVAGFSDTTSILFPLTTCYDIATIYGQNISPFGMNKLHKSQKDFLNIITGKLLEEKSYDYYEDTYQEKITGLEYYNLDKKVYWKTLNNKDLKVTGRIIGGCLDIIAELSGTKYDGTKNFINKYKNDGIIWYFDNCELSMEETIRVLWKLNELNYFAYTKAIIFGRFGSNTTMYNYDTRTSLEDSILNELNIDVIYDADISHKSPTLTIINGSLATIQVKQGSAKIKFELK